MALNLSRHCRRASIRSRSSALASRAAPRAAVRLALDPEPWELGIERAGRDVLVSLFQGGSVPAVATPGPDPGRFLVFAMLLFALATWILILAWMSRHAWSGPYPQFPPPRP